MPSLIDNYQSAVTLTETIAEAGVFPSGVGNIGMTIGMFHTYGFNFGLASARMASGQMVDISLNTALFALIGTTYGGDGVNNFALPNLGGRVSMGQGTGAGLSPLLLGQTPGAASSLITQSQLPASLGGTGSSVDEDQPGLGVRYLIRTEGIYPPNGGGSISLGFIGSVVKYAGNFTPGSYLECAGQLLDIGLYTNLFQIIGTTYGGNGVTNFALPDLRGRTIVGAGGSHFAGEVFGQENVTVTQANLPADMGGSGIPVDNREPSLVMNYAIALQGLFPSRDGGADPDTPMVGEIIVFAGNYPPGGFALCQGQLLPINQNTALFSLLGTQFGGDGRTTFALPDLRGRAVLGSDAVHLTGEIFGSDQIILTRDSIPDLNYSGGNGDETLYGGNGNDTINGQGGSDSITSHDGNDSLDGGGGNDTLTGGLGNDRYYVDNILDSVIEQAGPGSGQDYIFSSVSFTIAANVERLYLTGSANINATGRAAQNDILVGNSGNNVIDGLSGNDLMRGGLGNDTYFVDSTLDTTDEVTGGGGTGDYVFASVSFTAAAGIERLYLLGAGNINATGRALQNDILVGNSGNNILDGLSGNDVMRGGLGNDTYYVDSTLDTTDEVTGGGGTGDYVYSTVSFTASQGIERLYLTGSAAINGTGRDAQNDILGGNSGANVLSGLTGNDVLIGGLGNDTLTGGAGLDIFRFDTALNAATNMDTITDFVAADDTIQLENAIFAALTVTGALAATAFNTGSAATQADDRIIYNTVTGALLYDADGLGGVAGVQFALLSTHPAGVSAADFLVY